MSIWGNKKAEKVADDSIELVGLEVQFVSGVGQPATGEKFLLYKSADGKRESDEGEHDTESMAGAPPDPKKKKKKDETWVPPIATSESENGPEEAKKTNTKSDIEAEAPSDDMKGKKYQWSACMRDNANEKDPAAVCATLARNASGNKAAKSADYTGQDIWLPSDADLVAMIMEARKEARMTQEVPQSNFIQDFIRTLANAAGMPLASDAQVEANKHLEALAQKASGEAPSDDLGGKKPKYAPGANKVVTPSSFTGQAPTDEPGNGPPIASKASKLFEGEATQMPEVIQGSMAANTGSIGSGLVQGTPLYKSAVDEFVARLEAQAPNKEAVAAAKAALAGAFDTPAPVVVEEEAPLSQDLIKELVMTGMEPMIAAFETVAEQMEALRADMEAIKATKSVNDPQVVELTAKVDDVIEAVEALEARVASKSTVVRPVIKSRVPAETQPAARRDAGVWEDSAFGVAASIG